jgi:hypothetical protein
MGIVNLGWFDSRYKLADISPEQFDLGWPPCLSSGDIATLQRPIPSEKKGVQATFFVMGPVSNLLAAIVATCPTSRTVQIDNRSVCFHSAPAFKTWLAAQGETPSVHIQAWFDAVGVAGCGQSDTPVIDTNFAQEIQPMEPPTLAAANKSDTQKSKRGNRKPSWGTVAMPYMKELYANGKFKSASVFYKGLKKRAGEKGSPFAILNHELYCAEAGTTVSEGSLGNAWPEIRAK